MFDYLAEIDVLAHLLTVSDLFMQYHVISTSESVFVRTISVGGTSVLKMLSSEDGEYVYVMTQEKVQCIKVAWSMY